MSLECPILCWMLSLNREYTKEEYDLCHNICKECIKHHEFPYEPMNPDSFRNMMSHMMPLLMMRHRRVPRAKWKDMSTPSGKRWIEQARDDMPLEKYENSRIGYSLCVDNSICGMAMCQGPQRKIIHIGLGVKQMLIQPPGATPAAYAESLAHKLTPLEMSFINKPEHTAETIVRRLSILLALKESYIKAIGQPVGFDWSRLEFNLQEKTARGDGHPIVGWEFRIFQSFIGVARTTRLIEEKYQCVVAFFRGASSTKFTFYDSRRELESWVQFLYIDQMIKVAPKLYA